MAEYNKIWKVAILDDDKNWCAQIQQLLERNKSLQIVGSATKQTDAVKLAAQFEPDIFIVDLKLQSKIYDGITATIAIREVSPKTDVIILTSSEDREDVLNSASVGAVRYVPKENGQKLLDEVSNYINYDFKPDKIIFDEFKKLRKKEALNILTEQEREVVRLLSIGIPRSDLAKTMYKSESTIKSQISSILKKLEVTNVTDAVAKINNGGVAAFSDNK